jgi:RNA polymerase sigma-70 factor (ECF subfamily)
MIEPFIPRAIRPAMTERPDQHPVPDTAEAGQDPESSIALLLRAKRGEQDAMEQLWARYLPRIRRWAHGRLPASSRGVLDTDDLAQEILVRAVQHVDTFQPRHDGAFQGYLRQMLKNRVLDEVRRAARRPAGPPLADEYATPDPSPLELAIGREALERYETALSQLTPLDQQLIFARVELDFSAAEIAVEFHKPSAAAAQMAVSRALMRLAGKMADA